MNSLIKRLSYSNLCTSYFCN